MQPHTFYHGAGHLLLTSAFGPALIAVVLAVALAAALLGLRGTSRGHG